MKISKEFWGELTTWCDDRTEEFTKGIDELGLSEGPNQLGAPENEKVQQLFLMCKKGLLHLNGLFDDLFKGVKAEDLPKLVKLPDFQAQVYNLMRASLATDMIIRSFMDGAHPEADANRNISKLQGSLEGSEAFKIRDGQNQTIEELTHLEFKLLPLIELFISGIEFNEAGRADLAKFKPTPGIQAVPSGAIPTPVAVGQVDGDLSDTYDNLREMRSLLLNPELNGLLDITLHLINHVRNSISAQIILAINCAEDLKSFAENDDQKLFEDMAIEKSYLAAAYKFYRIQCLFKGLESIYNKLT